MFKYEGISSSPPKALLSEGSWFLCSYTSCSESSLDLVLKIKQKLKPWEELLCSVEYSFFLIKKKKLPGTKVCNLQTLRYFPVTSLYDITRAPSACFFFFRLEVGEVWLVLKPCIGLVY